MYLLRRYLEYSLGYKPQHLKEDLPSTGQISKGASTTAVTEVYYVYMYTCVYMCV